MTYSEPDQQLTAYYNRRWSFREWSREKSWRLYIAAVKLIGRNTNFPAEQSIDFRRDGLKIGRIDENLTEQLIAASHEFQPVKFTASDCIPYYVATELSPDQQQKLNSDHTYFRLTEQQLDFVRQALQQMRKPIEQCTRTPWKVVNVRSWATSGKGQSFGPNGWHLDGLPDGIHKVLIYLTKADAHNGTTEIKLPDERLATVQGPPGTWVFFDNNKLWHRGVAPSQHTTRLVIEVTIVPSLFPDQTPLDAGQNARVPNYPWDMWRNHKKNAARLRKTIIALSKHNSIEDTPAAIAPQA